MNPITLFFTGLVIFFCILFFFYRKVIIATQVLITIFFFLGIFGILSAVFIPSLYSKVVENTFQENFFGRQLQYTDNTLTTIGEIPDGVIDSIEGIFGKNDRDGKFQSNLYSSFVSLLSSILRGIILLFSVFLLIFSTYFRYSFAGLREYNKLQKRVEKLEKDLGDYHDKD